MTPEERALKFQREQDERKARITKAKKGMLDSQIEAIESYHKNMRHILSDVEEMNDLWLSQIRDMSKDWYRMGREFDLDNSSFWEWQNKQDG